MTRYFIGSDGFGHKYLVPVQHRDEWNLRSERFENNCDKDEDEYPEFNEDYDFIEQFDRVEGRLTFTDPRWDI